MFPHGFLAAVLPPPGHGFYCAAGFTAVRKQHAFAESIDDFEHRIPPWLADKRDIYFALATYEARGSRKVENARYIRTIAIDMDGYPSKKLAAQALSSFLHSTGLDDFGTPWIVASGGGLHCYWVFEQVLPIVQWRPVAEQFKVLCREQSLSIDMTVTADAARVLRIPDTLNFKSKYPKPRPVTLLLEGAVGIDFEAFAAHVKARVRHLPQEPTVEEATAELFSLPGKRLAPAATTMQLLSSSVTRFKNIMTRTGAGSGCAQLQYFVDRAADEGMEPLWRGWLSIAKACDDGEKASKWLSGLHPYEEERRQQKMREIKGPYPCLKFSSENPGICNSCPHFGHITNPLALGREIVADTRELQIEMPPLDPELEDNPEERRIITRPKAPYGYTYGINGGVFANKMVEEADGTKRKKEVMILPDVLFVADLLNVQGEHSVHMVLTRKEGPADIIIPQRAVVSKDETVKALAASNVLAAYGSGNDKNLFDYVRACVEDASGAKKPISVPAQYGWQEDDSFVFSGKIYKPDGTTLRVPMKDLDNITRITKVKGSLAEWRRYPQMLIKRGLTDILSMMCIGFGAPLMRYSQLAGLTFHGGSTESGTGKSLALSLLSSIWGHPTGYRTGKATSAVTMQQRMGNLNSLPFTSDEITHKSRHDLEWFPGLIFDFSEGQGKEKSETHHNRERINNVSWSTLAYFTSNTYMHDYLSGGRGHASQGELFRLLEWNPEKKLEWTSDEEDLLKSLNFHHGVAGEKYVRWLVQHSDVAKRVYNETLRELKSQWEVKGDERYWLAGCAACIAGAVLASSAYADVIDLPIRAVREFFFGLIKKARRVVASGTRTAVDILNAYTRENYGQFVVIKLDPTKKMFSTFGDGRDIDQTITRSKVMGRVEHEIESAGFIEYFLEEQVIKSHCVAMSFGYESFKEKIASTPGYRVTYVQKNMMAGTRGPQMRVRAMCISRPIAEAVEVQEQGEKAL